MKRMIFYHIEKCAGTSLYYLIRNFASSNEFLALEQIYTYANEVGIDISALQYERVCRAKVIHDPFCVIDWKSELSNCETVCLFRNPIDRLYSFWMMISSLTESDVSGKSEYALARTAASSGFAWFVNRDNPLLFYHRWNFTTRSLLFGEKALQAKWDSWQFLDDKNFKAQCVAAALRNLDRIDIVGIVEYFDRSMNLLSWILHQPPVTSTQKHNVRGDGRYSDCIGVDAADAVRGFVELDEIIYRAALEKFTQLEQTLPFDNSGIVTAALQARYLEAVREPPQWVHLTMDEALRGRGWHAREVNGSKTARWMGPNNISYLDVRIQKDADLLIRARCTGFLAPEQLDAFSIWVGEYRIETVTWVHLGEFRFFEGVIPLGSLGKGVVLEIVFRCDELRRSPDPQDPRLLGLEFAEVEIGPVNGFIVGAKGTP